MDIDRYIVENSAFWSELEAATAATRRRRNLHGASIDRLMTLYQRASSQLSYVRVTFDDPALTSRLTTLVANARATIYGTRPRSWRSAIDGVTYAFPVALWRIRWFVAASAALFFVPAVIFGVWLANSDVALDAELPAEYREAFVEEEFEDYYSSAPAAQFSTQVLINNIQVSFLAFASGIVVCVGTAWVLITNGRLIGATAGVFHNVDQPGHFWGLVLPHGLLEITAVVIAGAAGLRIGWAIVDPGDRSRAVALAEEAHSAVTVIIGLVAAFVVAGIIEGFVTPSDLPTAMRVGVGALVELAFLTYVVAFHRGPPSPNPVRARRQGQRRPVALVLM